MASTMPIQTTHPDAQLISEAMATDTRLDALAGGSSGTLGRGGMVTKLQAARLAARSGCSTVIAGGRNQHILHQVAAGENGRHIIVGQSKTSSRPQAVVGRTVAG